MLQESQEKPNTKVNLPATMAITARSSTTIEGPPLLFFPTMDKLEPNQNVGRKPGMAAIVHDNVLAALPYALIGDKRTLTVSNHNNKVIAVVLTHRKDVMSPDNPLHGYVYPVANNDAFSHIENSGSEYVANRSSFRVGSPAILVTPSSLMKQGIQVFTLNETLTRTQWHELSRANQSGFDFIAQACKAGFITHENRISNINPIDLDNWQKQASQAACITR